MSRGLWIGFVLLATGAATCELSIRAAEPDVAPGAARVGLAAKLPGPLLADAKPAATIARQFATIRAEFDAAQRRATVEAEKGKSEFESWKTYGRLVPDPALFSRRMVDLAATEPQSPAARDALLWVIDKPNMGPGGPYSDEFTRAVLLLLRFHGDDPEVARVGLVLNNLCNPARDLFLEGLYIQARGHEAKGLASMALAQYLQQKAKTVTWCRNARGPAQTKVRILTFEKGGKRVETELDIPPEQLAYQLHLRMTDPEAVFLEARRLFDEVIKQHGDITYATRSFRELEAMLKEPTPTWNGKPLTADERKQAERMLRTGKRWQMWPGPGSTRWKTWSQAKPLPRSRASPWTASRSSCQTFAARSLCSFSGAPGAARAWVRFPTSANWPNVSRAVPSPCWEWTAKPIRPLHSR